MDILIRFGFSIEEIKNMMDTNPEINNVLDDNVSNIINLLSENGCNTTYIKNIFICNPFVITKKNETIKNLIFKLKELNIDNLNILFDINPYILNLTSSKIEKIYLEKEKNGLSKNEIIEYLSYNIII